MATVLGLRHRHPLTYLMPARPEGPISWVVPIVVGIKAHVPIVVGIKTHVPIVVGIKTHVPIVVGIKSHVPIVVGIKTPGYS